MATVADRAQRVRQAFNDFSNGNPGPFFANLQASPMGRPIYERMGFVTMTEYRVLAAP